MIFPVGLEFDETGTILAGRWAEFRHRDIGPAIISIYFVNRSLVMLQPPADRLLGG